MRNLLLTLFLALIFAGQVTSQTITVHFSGTVNRDSTGVPVPDHQVIIQADSNAYGFHFYATRITNPNGFYDCTIHEVPATGAAVTFVVTTKNCDSTTLTQTFTGSATPDTVNFVICNYNTTGCEAAFLSEWDPAQTGLFRFFDTSHPQGQITAWNWNFGDPAAGPNNISMMQNPYHLFSAAGTYTVCLTIATTAGCTSHRCQEVIVDHNPGCEASFHFYPDSTDNLNVHFFDASTPANAIASRFWLFGDGGTATTSDPWHWYASPGVYTVCLRIFTTDSCYSEKCDELTIGTIPPYCESWLTYNLNFLTVHFEGHTHSPYQTTYTWHMGDPASTTLTGVDPSFTFPAAGSYVVTLVTLDSLGCEFPSTLTIHVNATCDVNGRVYAANALVDHGIVDLIRVDGGVMTIVDTKEISDSLGMYAFGGVLPGHYYLKATLLPSSAYYGQYIPTYYQHAINWTEATLIELGQPSNPYNFEMVHALSYNSGPGTISGVISQNAKINSGGTPAPNVEILLRSTSNEALACAMSDQDGTFEFANMAFGTYSIYPEIVGKNTIPTVVALDNTTPSVSTAFTIQGNNILGINDRMPGIVSGISEIFPNPSVDKAYISIVAVQETEINLSVYYITGQVATEFRFSLNRGANQLSIPVKNLSGGLYYMSIKEGQGAAVIRKMIIRK